jgi:hypothetical protein
MEVWRQHSPSDVHKDIRLLESTGSCVSYRIFKVMFAQLEWTRLDNKTARTILARGLEVTYDALENVIGPAFEGQVVSWSHLFGQVGSEVKVYSCC